LASAPASRRARARASPAFPTTTKTGTISFSSDGVQSVSLGGHLLTTTPQTFRDGTTGSLTASYSFNAVTGQGTITYTYTLLDNTLGVPSASFAVVVIDHDGEQQSDAGGPRQRHKAVRVFGGDATCARAAGAES